MLRVQAGSGRVSFTVRLVPRASANALGGERDGQLLARVTAPPIDGAANDALVRLLAESLGVSRSEIRLERGAGARTKRLSVPERAREALLRLV